MNIPSCSVTIPTDQMNIHFCHKNEWIMRVTKERKLQFNKDFFPDDTIDEFTQKVISTLENAFPVKFEKINQWINVKDKLPNHGESVIVWTTTGICIAEICGKTITGSRPTWIETNGESDFWNVTHWMPLPTPPDEATT